MTTSGPAVSVVIPTYNRAHMIEQAVRSALAQTTDDIEVLVVDDASTDETERVVTGIDDPRVRYLRHETNRGGGAARNTGIEAARAPYVAFLDSDDAWHPEKLERQLDVFERSEDPADLVVYAGAVAIDVEGHAVDALRPQARGMIRGALLRGNCVGSASAVMVPRRCLERVGGFDEALPSSQDRDLWIRLARHYPFEYVAGEPLVRYRVHDGPQRLTRNASGKVGGLEAMLEKYGGEFRKEGADVLADHHYRLGLHHLRAGHLSEGRRHLRCALRAEPRHFRASLHFCMSLFGKRVYAWLWRLRGELQRRDRA